MLSIAAMGNGSGHYYSSLATEDYYLKGGEPPGQWAGSGAERLQLGGAADGQALSALLDGFAPDGFSVVQNAGNQTRQPGWDLTFSAPKSVSVLWALSDHEVRIQIQAAQDAAVRTSISYLEEQTYTRRGKGGLTLERAKPIVALYEHGTSRLQDPQLHTHALWLNACVRDDGTTGTILSKPLYQHKMVAGALYRAELASQLVERLGLRLEQDRFSFKVAGIPAKLSRAFSKRRAEIEEVLQSFDSKSGRAAEVAALGTRSKKEHLPREALFQIWKDVAIQVGWTPAQFDNLFGKRKARAFGAGRADRLMSRVLTELTTADSFFPERNFLRKVAEKVQDGRATASELRESVQQALRNKDLVLELDGVKGEKQFTTPKVVEMESKLLDSCQRLFDSSRRFVSKASLERAVSAVEKRKKFTLSAEQHEAVAHLTSDGGRLRLLSGIAGSGKTTVLEAARVAWERKGYKVYGAALSGKAAEELSEGSGIRSATLESVRCRSEPSWGFRLRHTTKQLWRAATGRPTYSLKGLELDRKSILVVDEAGMIGTRQMKWVVDLVSKSGATLVAVGEDRQIQPIEAGGPFRTLRSRFGAGTLNEINRQKEAWMKAAVKEFAEGKPERALRRYADRGFVHVASNRNQAADTLLEYYRQNHLDSPESVLILTSKRAEAAFFNREIQISRRQTHAVGKLGVHIGSGFFYRNDRILFEENSSKLGVKNGMVGTVLRINHATQSLTVRLDGEKRRKTVTFSNRTYNSVSLGYAVTTHKVQGTTVDHALIFTGGSMQDRELTYVQASRSRHSNMFFMAEDVDGRIAETLQSMRTSHAKTLATEHRGQSPS